MLYNYLPTYQNAKIQFYASDMILYIDSSAAYLAAPNIKSRSTGYYYYDNKTSVTNPIL